MNAQISSPRTDRPFLASICRVTTLDRVALTFATIFLFCVLAVAALGFVAIGDAPQGRMWAFLATYGALGLGIGIGAPWALCRMLHATVHAARIRRNRTARARNAEPMAAFFQAASPSAGA